MRRSFTWLCLALLFAARAARAEPQSPGRSVTGPREEPSWPLPPSNQPEVRALAHLGVATTPFPLPALPQAKGQALILMASAGYPLSQNIYLDVRIPLVLGSVAQPAGSYLDTSAFGNPELAVSTSLPLGRGLGARLTLSAGLGVGAPLANHDDRLLSDRLLAVADGIQGRGHPEWFTPGVLPVTSALGFHADWSAWRVRVQARLPLLVRVAEVGMPRDATREVGVAGVLEGLACVRLSESLSVAASAHLFAEAVAPVRPVREVTRLQDLERLALYVHLSTKTALHVELQTAAGGALGGSMVGGGLGARMAF